MSHEFSGILSEMTIEDVKALDPQVVVLGIGSTEPHGPALPYGTDFFIADHTCQESVRRANKRGARVLMYPTLPIGNNVNFKSFPFACRVRVRTLMHVLLDIIEAIEEQGVRKIVLCNCHGGNTDTVNAVLREHMDRRRPSTDHESAFVCVTGALGKPPELKIKHPSPHAGEAEASFIMHLRPELVKTDKFCDQPMIKPVHEILDGNAVTFVKPWHLFLPMSGGGDSRLASAEKGRDHLEAWIEGIADFLVTLDGLPWGPNFPYPETGA